jgi:hypothetical protein
MTMFPTVRMEIYSPVIVLLTVLLVYVWVPRQKFSELFWYGLFGGFLSNAVFLLCLGECFHLFEWEKVYPFRFLGYSLWDDVFMIFLVIFFVCFLPPRQHWTELITYIIVFGIIQSMHNEVFRQLGLLKYYHWNAWYRFLLGVIWFSAITGLYFYEHRESLK